MPGFNEKNVDCLVTGVAGFVGSHLAERLLSLGHGVVGVDNFASGYPTNLSSFADHPAFAFHERSVTEPNLLVKLKESHPNLGRCFHLAAVVSVPYSVEHPEETMDVNYHSTMMLLHESGRLRFEAFVFAGSAAEYGNDQRLPLREEYATEETAQLSPYGRAKFLSSQAVARAPHGAALRFFNIFGPRQDPKSPYSGVISKFIELAFSGKPLTIFGDGFQTRDFIYVSDVVDAYLCAAGLMGASKPPPGIYNIGTGVRTPIVELAETVRELSRRLNPCRFLPERPGDIRHSVASAALFSGVTGWVPKISLKDGLRDTMDSCR